MIGWVGEHSMAVQCMASRDITSYHSNLVASIELIIDTDEMVNAGTSVRREGWCGVIQ